MMTAERWLLIRWNSTDRERFIFPVCSVERECGVSYRLFDTYSCGIVRGKIICGK